jgi:hypothetical protein
MDAKRLDDLVEPPQVLPSALGDVSTDHPILTIPFTAEINGRHCLGSAISLVRAQVTGLIDPALNGQERIVRLNFAFQGFTVTLSVDCRIHMVGGSGGGSGGGAILVFTDPTGDHLPQLRHLLNGWIAGDLVSMGQVLGVNTAPLGGTGPKSGAAPSGSGLGARLFGTAAMLALAAGLVVTAMTLTYARGYVVTLPVAARIVAEGQVLTALAAGQIDYVNPAAAEGEVAFTLRADSGQILSVTMPCDCITTLEGIAPGATVQAGDPILSVHAADAALTARVSLPAELMFDLAQADGTTLTLADGRRVTARPALPLPNPAGREGDLIEVTLLPDGPALDPALAGALAEVTITKRSPALLAPARALFRAFGG